MLVGNTVADLQLTQHDGKTPRSKAEKEAFKDTVASMKRKIDEENFDEAITQAYRVLTETKVPYLIFPPMEVTKLSMYPKVPPHITELFNEPNLDSLSPTTPPFFILLAALKAFTQHPPYTLPLSATLPDIKADTTSYVHLQKLYKSHAEEERKLYKELLRELINNIGVNREILTVDSDIVDEFVKNAHGLVVLRGKRWGEFGKDKAALGKSTTLLYIGYSCDLPTAECFSNQPRETATFLALNAVQDVLSAHSGPNANSEDVAKAVTVDSVTAHVRTLLPEDFSSGDLSEELKEAIGEMSVFSQ